MSLDKVNDFDIELIYTNNTIGAIKVTKTIV